MLAYPSLSISFKFVCFRFVQCFISNLIYLINLQEKKINNSTVNSWTILFFLVVFHRIYYIAISIHKLHNNNRALNGKIRLSGFIWLSHLLNWYVHVFSNCFMLAENDFWWCHNANQEYSESVMNFYYKRWIAIITKLW